MANANEIREWAASEGMTVGAKGRIPAVLKDAYDAAHPGSNGAVSAPDYPDDDFESFFGGPESNAEPLDTPPLPDDTGETKPSRPRASSKAKTARPSWMPGGKSKPKRKPTQPRVSTEGILGGIWRGGAKLLTPLPPLQRTLRMQAPVAGMLLDDVVKGTFVDPLLQPLARIAARGKEVQALVGPPAFVSAIMAHQVQRASMDPPQQPNPLFMAIATEGLRNSLMAWMDVSGPKFEEAMRHEQEFEAKYGSSVDDMIALIFAQPPADEEAMMAEEEAIKRAQGIL